MLRISIEMPSDVAAREALLDAAFGPERAVKTCERLREGRLPAHGLALAAHDASGCLVGTLRFWHVMTASGHAALMLGPLAVAESHRCSGLGGQLMRRGLTLAGAYGHKAVLLVGDEPYYRRFGFSRAMAADLDLPGWYQPERFLALELQPGGLKGAQGMVFATGALEDVLSVPASQEGEALTEGDRG